MSQQNALQSSNIARNIAKGSYLKQFKFAAIRSKEGLLAQQKEAERLAAIRAMKQAAG